jgi:lipoprotein-anchoring transpeptidase ErfK/SrfK
LFVTVNLTKTNPQTSTAEGYNADLSGQVYQDERFAYVDETNVELPEYVYESETPHQVLGVASGEKWIEVDLSEQKLYAWEGNNLYLETLISSGLPGTETPTGEFRIWIKLRATKMEGGSGSRYYYLPNVPYTMFFENAQVPGWKGYGLHGTYWHNDFGRQKSHGCVNLPTPIAQQLYEWVSPVISNGKGMVRSSAENPGTRIVIHQ